MVDLDLEQFEQLMEQEQEKSKQQTSKGATDARQPGLP